MKPASIKAKGRDAENAVVDYIRTWGWPDAERRRLTGARDKGDVAGIPKVCLEVKSANRIDIPGWMRETEKERLNAGADIGALVVKPKGVGDTRTGEWPVFMSLSTFLTLLRQAGYQYQVHSEGNPPSIVEGTDEAPEPGTDPGT